MSAPSSSVAALPPFDPPSLVRFFNSLFRSVFVTASRFFRFLVSLSMSFGPQAQSTLLAVFVFTISFRTSLQLVPPLARFLLPSAPSRTFLLFLPSVELLSLLFGHVCPGCSVWPLLVSHPVHFPALQCLFPVLPFGTQASRLVSIFVSYFSLRP